MTPACSLLVFAKAPLPGQVKTRLTPVLGPDGAARLATRMLEDTLRRALTAQIGPVTLCCAPDEAHSVFRAAAERGVQLAQQGYGDLGARMQRALEQALRTSRSALLIGTDAPDLSPALLRQAAAALATHDAVFVPALDGGYVLVGLSRPCPALFADIAWSTGEVMRQTREQAARARISLCELAPLRDIDEPEDIEYVPKEWLK